MQRQQKQAPGEIRHRFFPGHPVQLAESVRLLRFFPAWPAEQAEQFAGIRVGHVNRRFDLLGKREHQADMPVQQRLQQMHQVGMIRAIRHHGGHVVHLVDRQHPVLPGQGPGHFPDQLLLHQSLFRRHIGHTQKIPP